MKKLLTEWREYIKEVERMADITSAQDEIQKSLDYFYKEHAPSKAKRQDLGDFKGHQMALFTGGEFGKDELMFVVDKDDRAIAYVATNPHEDAYAIGNVRKVKGGGFYITDLYKWLVDKYGTLYSDSKQTTAGESIWKRLQQDPEVQIEEPSDETGNRWRATK
jgi:hypothetical protein|tara:strand:- start:454 stop:942 length:489 start_codon:yes stop_codon:yes gene_type:complete